MLTTPPAKYGLSRQIIAHVGWHGNRLLQARPAKLVMTKKLKDELNENTDTNYSAFVRVARLRDEGGGNPFREGSKRQPGETGTSPHSTAPVVRRARK
jgi:hypothetical protein